MKRSVRIGLIILLVIVVIFDVREYFLLINKFIKTSQELEETIVQLGLEQKARHLLQGELKATRQQLQKVKAELKGTHRELNNLNNRLSGLEKNNLALLEEKERLEAKLHSLKELKKAIRQIRLEHHQERVQQSLVKKQYQKEIDTQRLTQGNCGYLFKDGHSLYQPKVKIEVNPTY
jgi:chromosome segregation ATPase